LAALQFIEERKLLEFVSELIFFGLEHIRVK
jgi:hypothetical protein